MSEWAVTCALLSLARPHELTEVLLAFDFDLLAILAHQPLLCFLFHPGPVL